MSNRPLPSAQRPERGPHLAGEELRLLPGGEVAAPVDRVEVGELAAGHGHDAVRRHEPGVRPQQVPPPAETERGRGRQATPGFAVYGEDLAWILGVVAQDEWGKICVEEMVRVMANSASRCAPMVVSLKKLDLGECIPAASSFFFALTVYDRLRQMGEVAPEVGEAVGRMLADYEAGADGPGIWSRCADLSFLSGDASRRAGGWPESAKASREGLQAALDSAVEARAEDRGPQEQSGAQPSGRARVRS